MTHHAPDHHADQHADQHRAHRHGDEIEDHDLGLSHDLPIVVERQRSALGRRGLLGLFGGLGVAAVVAGCGTDETATSGTGGGPGGAPPAGGGGTESTVAVADGEIPEETAGPFPGDGSNGVNVLTASGIVRSDITTSFGDASGVAAGVPLTVELTVYDLDGDAVTTLEGGAVYLWHANRDGEYSLYSSDIAEENYLRGVQETDADGKVTFTTVFPACYDGRWPHLHFEVYPSLAEATTASNKLRTSQIALPQASCEEVYGTAEGYETSVTNLARVSLSTDNVFSDGVSLQTPKMTGSVARGYTLTMNVPI